MEQIIPEQITNDVVHLAQLGDGVGEITMRDTVTKNGSSPEIIQGLTDSFRCVGADDTYKVVILTGYGNYFLSGGTKEDLQQLQSGQRSTAMFIDLVRLIVDCPL